MSESFYVVSQREGDDAYSQAVVFTGETAEDDANDLATSLTETKPNVTHKVMTADEFSRIGEEVPDDETPVQRPEVENDSPLTEQDMREVDTEQQAVENRGEGFRNG